MANSKQSRDDAKGARQDSRRQFLLSLLDRASIRLGLILAPTCVIAFIFAVSVTPLTSPLLGRYIASSIDAELAGKIPSSFESMDLVRRYGLSWCFITDQNNQVMSATASFAPPTRRIPIKSQEIKIRDHRYYDSVLQRPDGSRLHIGLPMDSSSVILKADTLATVRAAIPFGSVLIAILAIWLCAVIFCESIFGYSVRLLGSCVDKLTAMLANRFTDAEVRMATTLTYATSEFRELGGSLAVLMRKVAELREEEQGKFQEGDRLSERQKFEDAVQRSANNEDAGGEMAAVETGVFAIQVDRVLAKCVTSYEFSTKLIEGLKTLYADYIDFVVFFRTDGAGGVKIEKESGFGVDGVEMLKRIDHRELTDARNMSKKSIEIGPMQLKRMGFEPLARQFQIGRILYLPLQQANIGLGLLAIFVRQGKALPPERVRSLERFRDTVVGLYLELVAREEEEDERWADPVTGLGNMTYFQELLPKVMERADERSGSFCFMLIRADFSAPDLVRFPSEMRHRWLTEVGQLLTTVLPVSRRLVPERGATNFLIRYQDDVIAAVLEGADEDMAAMHLERVRSLLDTRTSWAGGITELPFAIALVSYPQDGQSREDLIRRADLTLSYIKEMLGGVGSCKASNVPADFQPKESTEIAGTLGVLNAADLLQSISTSENTGVLTVDNEVGQQFVCSFIDGIPKQASMGEFSGMQAVCEFIITFKRGHYNFQQRRPTEAEATSPSELHSIEYCLMEAALAEDKMNAALTVVPKGTILVRGMNNPEAIEAVSREADVTPQEITVMQDLHRLADGNCTLDAIFKKLTGVPSYLKWRAAALLIESGLMQWKHPGS